MERLTKNMHKLKNRPFIKNDWNSRYDLLTTHLVEHSLLKQKTMFYIHGDKSDKMLANLLKGEAKYFYYQKGKWPYNI